jgi:hypothetical protein
MNTKRVNIKWIKTRNNDLRGCCSNILMQTVRKLIDDMEGMKLVLQKQYDDEHKANEMRKVCYLCIRFFFAA